jgi:SOS-response transcriptional repressor LexA
MRNLTDRQIEMARFIQGYFLTHRCSPTIRELGDALGIGSTNGVNDYLRALERKGYLDRESHAARMATLSDKWCEEELGGHFHYGPCDPTRLSCRRHMGLWFDAALEP